MMHPEVFPAPVELVKLQSHVRRFRSRSVCGGCARVFSGRWRECARKSHCINEMQPNLVFCGAHQKCAHNAKEISSFAAGLIFRDVPGKSVQRSGHTQRLRLPFLCAAPLETIAGGIIRVLRPPLSLGLVPSHPLALRLTARPLTHSNPWMGTEPATADRTGSLPGSGHRDSSSPRHYPPVGLSN